MVQQVYVRVAEGVLLDRAQATTEQRDGRQFAVVELAEPLGDARHDLGAEAEKHVVLVRDDEPPRFLDARQHQLLVPGRDRPEIDEKIGRAHV